VNITKAIASAASASAAAAAAADYYYYLLHIVFVLPHSICAPSSTALALIAVQCLERCT
jgi:uncharacterized membrane protein required for colicin V production